jgi:glycosyltransferase involved in cell wall biosynthesis
MKKSCAIIGMKNSIYCPFEVADNQELSKHFNTVQLYFLRKNKVQEKPKYNNKIKIISLKLSIFNFIKIIFFSKKFYESIKIILLSNDIVIEKIKQLILLPSALIISNKINFNPPDVVYLFWGHYPSLVVLNLKKNLSSKIIIFLGAYDFRKKLNISRIACSKSNAVFTHTKKRINQIKKFVGHDLKVICNYRGVNLEQFKNKYNKKKKYTFCTVSVLEKHKNIESVIYIFQNIKNIYPKSKLFIIGKGSLENKLKQLVKNLKLDGSVDFLGWLPKLKLYKILYQTQFYLHFSKVDVIPNSIKEAMYSRCIVLSSKTFAIEEIIDHAKNGFLVNPNNVNNILKIINSCTNNVYAKKIIEKARMKIKQNFDIKKNIKSFVNHVLH